MRRISLSDVSDVSMPDLHLPPAPDVSGLSESLHDLVENAADAVSSAAGRVPGLHDYRASNRRRNLLVGLGAIAAVAVLVAVIRRRRDDVDAAIAQSAP